MPKITKKEKPGSVKLEVAAEKLIRPSLVPPADGVFAEAIFDSKRNPPIQFAVYAGGKVAVKHSIQQNGTECYPPSGSIVAKGILLLPSAADPYGTQGKLLTEIERFIHRYADVEPFWERLIAHYVCMTWVYDRFSALPYLRFVGEPGTGKSRLLQVVAHLSYKATIVGAGMTVSPMFRVLDRWRGTFAVDEAEMASESSSELARIFNAGYMRGTPLMRSEVVGDSFEATGFDVFGPKIIANRSRFHDAGLESRCLTLQTTDRSLRNDVPRQLPANFYEEARGLRNKLLRYRFNNFERIRPDESKLADLDPRRAQIAVPICAVIEDGKFRHQFIVYLRQQQLEERTERPQYPVALAICNLCAGNPSELAVKDVAAEAQKIRFKFEGGGLIIGTDSLSAKRVGGIITSLGFEKRRTNDGYKFTVDKKRLSELERKYSFKSD